MRHTLTLAGLLATSLTLGGCATTMSQNECAAVDWQTIGYEDGAAGYSGEHIAQHRRACAKYGVVPNLGLYQAGRAQGLREYCRPQNGYSVGVHGGRYDGVCPVDLEVGFLTAYDAGRHLYTLENRVENADNRLAAARHELDEVEHQMIGSSVVLVSANTSDEERAHSLLTTTQLAERSGRLKTDIAELERDRARYERDLEDYRASQPSAD